MKKKWLIVICAVFLTVAITTVSFAASQIKLIVNGKEIMTDIPPQMINGRAMVPIRWWPKHWEQMLIGMRKNSR